MSLRSAPMKAMIARVTASVGNVYSRKRDTAIPSTMTIMLSLFCLLTELTFCVSDLRL